MNDELSATRVVSFCRQKVEPYSKLILVRKSYNFNIPTCLAKQNCQSLYVKKLEQVETRFSLVA